MNSLSVLTLVLAALVGSGAVHAQGPAAEARITFAELLKIPLTPPGVEPIVAGSREEGGIVVEDVSWEGLDGERVPAYVLRRADLTGPAPAIICLHGSGGSREAMVTEEFGRGTWTEPSRGRAHPRMKGWARELARRGYVALAMTQRGLGGRTPPINEQSNVMLVRGRTGMGAVIHEIRQAVTYLASRPDVDPERIGTTGMSFGGITAFYSWIVDYRVAAAAAICGGVGSVGVFAQEGSIGYHGTYWWVPDLLAAGDQARFAAALAPKPLMLWAPREDIGMPKAGVDRFVREVGPAYERAAEARVDRFVRVDGPAYGRARATKLLVVHQPAGGHSFTVEAFEAMVGFFEGALR